MITALQDGRHRPAGFAQPPPQGGEIFKFERHRGDRITSIAVETGRDEDEVRAKPEDRIEGGTQRLHVIGPRGMRGHRPVADIGALIPGAGSGVTRILMDRRKEQRLAAMQDRLGAVAVMGVEIPDRNPPGAQLLLGSEGRDRNLVQVAKPHRLGNRGMMPRRAHEGKNRFPRLCREGVLGGFDGPGHRTSSVAVDLGKKGGISVKIAAEPESLQMRGGVGEEQPCLSHRGGGRFPPNPVRMGFPKMRRRPADACRLFGTHGRAVLDAMWIMEDQHRKQATVDTNQPKSQAGYRDK